MVVFGASEVSVIPGVLSMKAAKAILSESNPFIVKRNFRAHISFENKQALHEGGSANLAIASLLYCSIVRIANQRVRYLVLPTASLTGNLLESGEVQPVDVNTLKQKMQAAIFSHIETLAVPKSQLQAAETFRDELVHRYPGGD